MDMLASCDWMKEASCHMADSGINHDANRSTSISR